MKDCTTTNEFIILFIFSIVNEIVLFSLRINGINGSNSDYLFVLDFQIPCNAKLFKSFMDNVVKWPNIL